MEKKYIVPAIAIPHQTAPELWISRPAEHRLSDGHDLHAILEGREQAERYVREKRHNWAQVKSLIEKAWPTLDDLF